MKNNFRIVPKMIDAVTLSLWLVLSNGDSLEIGRVRMPSDGQMNDNLECAQTICDAIKKRIRKSV